MKVCEGISMFLFLRAVYEKNSKKFPQTPLTFKIANSRSNFISNISQADVDVAKS